MKKRLCDDYSKAGEDFSKINKTHQFYPTTIVPFIEFTLIFVIFLSFIIISNLGILSTELISSFVIILIVSIRVFQSSAHVVTISMKIKSLTPSVHFIFNELKNLNEKVENSLLVSPKEKVTKIKVKDLKFSYENKLIFEKASINFQTGSINIILAKSGYGKSTFLNILSGLIKSYEGNIYINDTNLNLLNKEIYKEKLDMLPKIHT